jgi:hypothetical protein
MKYPLAGCQVYLRKEILIMKDKSIKQPWPRSAKITVWVLGVVLALSFVWHMSFRVAAYDHIQNLEYKIILGESDKDYLRPKLRGEFVMDSLCPSDVTYMNEEADDKARNFCFSWCPDVFFMPRP